MTYRGGMRILEQIEARDYDVLRDRPRLDTLDVAGIATVCTASPASSRLRATSIPCT